MGTGAGQGGSPRVPLFPGKNSPAASCVEAAGLIIIKGLGAPTPPVWREKGRPDPADPHYVDAGRVIIL